RGRGDPDGRRDARNAGRGHPGAEGLAQAHRSAALRRRGGGIGRRLRRGGGRRSGLGRGLLAGGRLLARRGGRGPGRSLGGGRRLVVGGGLGGGGHVGVA